MSVVGTATIPKLTPGLNETKRWDFQAGRSGSTWKQKDELRIWGRLVRSAFGGGRNETPMYLTLSSHRVRLLDPDNFMGGLKHLLDALKRTGLIVDDGPDWLTLAAEQVKVRHRHQQKTVLTLEVLETEGAREERGCSTQSECG